MQQELQDAITRIMADAAIAVEKIEERPFPGEQWVVVFVKEESVQQAQNLAGRIENELNQNASPSDTPFAVVFRPSVKSSASTAEESATGRLASARVSQLIQLLEARSRASDALPSLRYVEDPRASLAAVAASRHQLVYGRRGVGKTSILLEAKRIAEKDGHVTAWVNVHVLRKLNESAAFAHIAEAILSAVAYRKGSSNSASFARIDELRADLLTLRTKGQLNQPEINSRIPEINTALRSVLRPNLVRLYVFLDDFHLIDMPRQAQLLDDLAALLRDCDGWLKIASIERLTRPFSLSARTGLEVPHDASIINLDVTLEDPAKAQTFLESVLANFTASAGFRGPSSIAKATALGRLVLASGGVPRDYLNLFASSIVVARKRQQPQEIGKEDVAKAAGQSALSKKRDLEQDTPSSSTGALISALERLSNFVKGKEYTYFRFDIAQKTQPGYFTLSQLVDMRFIHLIQAALSDQHQAGTKYEVYLLDLSEYTDVRLKRNLNILDLENGQWKRLLSGKAKTESRLSGTQFRDLLRQSPLVDASLLEQQP